MAESDFQVFVKVPNYFQRLENNFKPGKYPFTGLLKWLDCVSFSHAFGGSSNNLKDLKESGWQENRLTTQEASFAADALSSPEYGLLTLGAKAFS